MIPLITPPVTVSSLTPKDSASASSSDSTLYKNPFDPEAAGQNPFSNEADYQNPFGEDESDLSSAPYQNPFDPPTSGSPTP